MDEQVGQPLWNPVAESRSPPYDGIPRGVGTPTYAGFWRRVGAAIIDGVIGWIIGWIVIPRLGGLLPIEVEADAFFAAPARTVVISFATTLVVSFGLGWLYTAGFESSPWRATPGKWLCGIAVTDLAGGRISFARATGRVAAEFLTGFFLIGYLVQPFTAQRQALHDVIARTLVTQVRG